MTTTSRWLLTGGLVAAGIAAVIAGRQQARQGVVVSTVTVQADTLQLEYSGIGLLEAAAQTDVSAQVAGRLVEVFVEEGDMVLTDMPMAQIEPEVDAADPEVLAGMRGQAAARVRGAMANMQQAALNLRRQESLRATERVVGEFVTEQELEAARNRLTLAKSEVDLAHGALREVRGRERVAVSQEGRALVRAPRDGIVIRRFHEAGEVVVPATYGGTVGRLFSIGDPDRARVRIPLPEALALSLGDTPALRVRLKAPPGTEWAGKLARVRPREGSQIGEGLRFEADIELEGGQEPFAFGATVIVDFKSPPVVAAQTVPLRVIAPDPSGADRVGIWVAKNGRAEFIPVTIGRAGTRSIELLSGTTPGTVVLDPSDAPGPLVPGQRVRLTGP